MGRTKLVAGLTLVVALIGGLSLWTVSNRGIRVGSKNFTEQVVLGEIIAQHLEHRLHQKVNRQLNLGGTLLAHGALVNQEIDLYPEYTGTALTAILKDPPDNDPVRVLARVRFEYARRFKIDWLDLLGIDNTFAMVVSGANARAKHLENLTDAAAVPDWALGVGYEFQTRPDGLAALDRTYHLRWTGNPQSMDLGLLYRALQGNQVTMIAANATDGQLAKMDLESSVDDEDVPRSRRIRFRLLRRRISYETRPGCVRLCRSFRASSRIKPCSNLTIRWMANIGRYRKLPPNF